MVNSFFFALQFGGMANDSSEQLTVKRFEKISPTSEYSGSCRQFVGSDDGEGHIVRGKYEYALTNQRIVVSIYGAYARCRQKV